MAILMSLLILGLVSMTKLSVRMYPDVEFPYVLVMTSYPGAGVSEIEQLVSKPIEDAMSGISGLKHVISMNQDNMSIVFGEFELSKNPDIAAQEVRDKVGQIRLLLPDDIKEPIIMKADMDSMPLITLSLKSDTLDPKRLYDFADDIVSKDLAQVSGVSQISILGGSRREIQVNANKEKLKEHELTLTAIASRIQANSLNIPAGRVDRGTREITFRTMGEFQSIGQIKGVVVSFMGNDVPVTVKDVAVVEDGVEQEVSRARLLIKEDGEVISEPSLLVYVYRQAKGNDVAISDAIKSRVAEVNKRYKNFEGSPKLTLISDMARGVRMNITDVQRTIMEGVFLAIVVVYFFLGSWRSTFITALALPNSLIGAFVFMYLAGFSLNVISLMSLSLAVGLLIDDAIIVRENIFRHYEEGSDPITAAVEGTNEVTLAVIATTSTVIAVFLPVAFLSGIMGQFFREFGLTVVFAMGISLLDALTIAPMLSAYMIPDHNKKEKNKPFILTKLSAVWSGVVYVFRLLTVGWFNKVFGAIQYIYRKAIYFIVTANLVKIPIGSKNNREKKRYFKISWRFITIVIAICIFVSSLVIAKTYLKTTFMPSSEWGEFNIQIEAKPGTSLDKMDVYAKEIEAVIMSEPDIEMLSSTIGSANMFTNLANQAVMFVKMIPAKERSFTTSGMQTHLREVLNEKYGHELDFSFTRAGGMGSGRSEFVVELVGDEVDVLYGAAQVLMEKFGSIPDFVDIKSNYRVGKPEMQILMDMKKMENLGVSSVMAGNEIRAMIDGANAGKFREGGTEYDIKVRLQENQRDLMKNFDSVFISNVNNKLVRLKNVATIRETSGPVQIFRKDRARYVTVEGNIAAGGTIGPVQKEAVRIFNETKKSPEFAEKWANIEFRLAGNAEEMKTMFQSMLVAGTLSLIFIFMVLASLYESVITPFTIMTALPLAIVGGILALLFANQPIDMFTMIGMIMLLGIVAKNSILMVDYIQQLMRRGFGISKAITKAGTIRLRPILMTSFALIAGMLPTALGLSEVGSFRKGMGIVVIGGIISSTVLTLLVVPAIFEYMDTLRHFLRRLFGRPDKRMIDYTDEELAKKKL